MSIQITYKKEKRPIEKITFGEGPRLTLTPNDDHANRRWLLRWRSGGEIAKMPNFYVGTIRDLRDACNAILGEE